MTFASISFAMQAEVISAKGKAEVQSGSSWTALKAGDKLSQGAVIQTGFKSEVVLKIKESTVTVASLSRVTIQSLAEQQGIDGKEGRDETKLFLNTGALKSNVQKSEDRRVGFTVRSPVATASVRGTEFSFSTTYKSARLSTSRGSVSFGKSPKNGRDAEISGILVSKGEEASLNTNGDMTKPSEMAKDSSLKIGNGTSSAAASEAGVIQMKEKGSGGKAIIKAELAFTF